MKKIINRDDIKEKCYREILDKETHHDHEIVEEGGVYRWKANKVVQDLVVGKEMLNDLMKLFYSLGYTRNSEVIRHLYRNIGYSLFGYWEVFYWDANNTDAENYVPNPGSVPGAKRSFGNELLQLQQAAVLEIGNYFKNNAELNIVDLSKQDYADNFDNDTIGIAFYNKHGFQDFAHVISIKKDGEMIFVVGESYSTGQFISMYLDHADSEGQIRLAGLLPK